MRSAVLFIALALQCVFNVPVITAVGTLETPTAPKSAPPSPSGVPGGDRGGKMKDKERFDALHRKASDTPAAVSDTRAARHERRDLSNEDALKLMTKDKEVLEKRRRTLEDEMKGTDRQRMLDTIKLDVMHRKVSDTLAAHHEGRHLLDEDALKRMTKEKEGIEERRSMLEEEGADGTKSADPMDPSYKMMFDTLHRKVSDTLGAHHEGRELLDEEMLKRMTLQKEKIEKRMFTEKRRSMLEEEL